jgi:hypothetical protein
LRFWREFALRASVLIAVLAAIGCGDPDSTDGSPRATLTPTAAPSSTVTAEVVTASVGTVVPETIVQGTPAPIPSATPLPPMDAIEVRLKYALLDRFGALWWCDPDFYPIAREDEQVLAEQRFPEIVNDAPSFAVMLEHLGLAPGDAYTPAQKLAVYRDWKVLRALQLESVGGAYRFNARFTHDEQTGIVVEGSIDPQGRITIASQADSEPPACPICLARGTRIATPRGLVAVEELRPGMTVWSNGADGAPVIAEVMMISAAPAPPWHRVVHLVLADGRSLRASSSHPLSDGRLLGEIARGDSVDGATVVRVEIEPYDGGATFDLLPSGPTGTYWADGIQLASTLRPSRTDPQKTADTGRPAYQ